MFTDSHTLTVPGEAGYVETWLRRIEGSDVVFGWVRSSGHSIKLRDTDRLTLLLPREGRLRVRIGPTDHDLSAARPVAFRPGERTTDAMAGPAGVFAATTLQLSVARLKEMAERAQVPLQGVLQQDVVDLRGRVDAAFLQGIKQLADDIFRLPTAALPPKVAAAAAKVIYEHLLAMIDSVALPSRPRVLPAFHRVRAAEEIMHDHGEDPLSMVDLAERLGCSLRSLQMAFHDVHDGLSPRQVYNQIRLQRARQKLLEASRQDQVTRIALDAGFHHLSRFAQTYARTFGELPSETLARRRT
jgi:AraC-like DNA-binding protein